MSNVGTGNVVTGNVQVVTAPTPRGPAGYGSSFWQPMTRCLQEWAYLYQNYVYLAGPVEREGTEAQALGVQVHDVLAEALTGRMLLGVWPGGIRIEGMKEASEIAMAALPALKSLTPVAIEQVYTLNLGTLNMPGHPQDGQAIVYEPRTDLFAMDRQGKVYAIDHKTESHPSEAVIEDYSRDVQFHGLAVIGEEMYGKDFGGVLIHLVRKHGKLGSELRKVVPEPAMVRRFKTRLYWTRHIVASLEVASSQGLLPWDSWPAQEYGGGCRRRYKCNFWHRCQWGGAG